MQPTVGLRFHNIRNPAQEQWSWEAVLCLRCKDKNRPRPTSLGALSVKLISKAGHADMLGHCRHAVNLARQKAQRK